MHNLFNDLGVIPPFSEADGPTSSTSSSPYSVSLSEFVDKFANSPERIAILDGFLQYRSELKQRGFVRGFQWVDGSFIENVETLRDRPPADLDLVTFVYRPRHCCARDEWKQYFQENRNFFSSQFLKNRFSCDGYYVDLSLPSIAVVSQTAYWFGLFSHQRETSVWKGLLQIDLSYDEKEAFEILRGAKRE